MADCAIELIHTIKVLEFLGYEVPGAVEVCTDSKAGEARRKMRRRAGA